MNPEDRDKILDILCQCGTTIKEGLQFEMHFTKKNHPAAADEMSNLEAMLCDQYRIALQLIYEIRHSCRKMKDEYESLGQKTEDWFKVRGSALWRKLSNQPLAWDSHAKAISRLKSEWTSEKKSLEDRVAYDKNTVEVRAWIKGKEEDPEPTISELAKRVMPEDHYANGADWLFGEDEFKNWCSFLQVSEQNATQSTPQTPAQPIKRVLWLRGGLGTGKTTLLYHAYKALRDDPELQPIYKELRVMRYFCNAKMPGTKPPSDETIIRSLTRQLALLSDFTIADDALKLYNNYTSSRNDDDRIGLDVWKKLFKDVIRSGSDQYNFVFLVDALDECITSTAAHDFLEFMSTVLKDTANVSLLCSSHKHISVNNYFGAGNDYAGYDLLRVVEVTAAKSVNAMKAFITGELERRKKKAKESVFCEWRVGLLRLRTTTNGYTDSHFRPDDSKYPHLRNELEASLTEIARGNFQWVKVWLDICINIRDVRAKTIKSSTIAEQRLQELRNVKAHRLEGYQAVNDAYQRLWDLSKVDDAEDLGIRIRLFRLILTAFQPQNSETLSVALRIQGDSYGNYPKPIHVEELFSGFLEEDRSSGYLQFVHNAAKAFVSQICREQGNVCENDDEASAVRRNHRSVAELYIDVMKSSNHPYWSELEIFPSDWKYAARSCEESNRLKESINYWRGGLRSSGQPSTRYLCTFGLRHCASAAGVQSMSDPLWHQVIERVIMEPKSAFAFSLMADSLIASGASFSLPQMMFREEAGRLELLYAHVLAGLNIINEEDLLELQKSEDDSRDRQKSSAISRDKMSKYRNMFKHAGYTALDSQSPNEFLARETALHRACRNDNPAAIRFILEITSSLDPNSIETLLFSKNGRFTELHEVILLGKINCAKALLEFEKQQIANAIDNKPFKSKQLKRNMLEQGMSFLKEDDICCLLELANPADIDAPTNWGPPLLHLACYIGHSKVVRLLVEKCNAQVDIEDNWGYSPCMIAFLRRHQAILEYFRTRGGGAIDIDFLESDSGIERELLLRRDMEHEYFVCFIRVVGI